MRGHTEREPQPPIEFIRLSELLEAVQAEEMDAPDVDAETQRRALSLFGLVASSDVAATEAAAERLEGLAALYIPESKQVIVIEDPGGVEPTEAELGVPVAVFNMSVLAHEYVHAYQDREYDLQEFQRQIPENFDGQLAAISAVEGEAVLYEYEFLFDVLDRQDIERREVFESLVDAAEEALADSDSPWIAARGIFPYTYGAHSAWSIESADGREGLEELRKSKTTLSYIERRFGALEGARQSNRDLNSVGDAGLERVVKDDLGAWLLNGFAERTLDSNSEIPLAPARQWAADEFSVWRGPDDEVLAQWSIAYAPPTPVADASNESDWSWSLQGERLAEQGPPLAGAGWLVSNQDETLVITSSTDANSAALSRLHTSHDLSSGSDASNVEPVADAGVPLPLFTYERVSFSQQPAPTPKVSAERARRENAIRRRLLRAVSPTTGQAK